MAWFSLSRKAKLAKASPRGFRPALESLEERVVPDVNYLPLTVDSNASTAAVSGTVAGANITQQGAGSLTTHYSGYLGTYYDDGVYSGTPSIQFLGYASSLVAANSGNWQPLPGGGSGSAPANYGAQASPLFTTAKAAIRGLTVTADSNPIPLNAAGNFVSTAETLSTTAGTADYNVSGLISASGTTSVAGQSRMNMSSTQGTLTNMGGGSFHITVPIQFVIDETVSGQSVHVVIQGTIVADAHLPVLTVGGSSGRDFFTNFAIGGPAVSATASDATITSTGSQSLSYLAITLINNADGTNELLSVNLGASGLSQYWDPSNATLYVYGSAPASLATIQTVLRTLQYSNSSSSPDLTNP
jgi:hypothetical protein